MNNLSFKNKKMLLAVGAGVITLILVVVVFLMIIPNLGNAKSGILSLRRKILAQEEQQQSIDQIKAALDEVDEEVMELDKVFLAEEKKVDFIMALENLAQSFDLIETIRISDSEAEAESRRIGGELVVIKSFPLQIEVVGSMPKTARFMKALESFRFLVSIENFQMRRIDSREIAGKAEELPGVSAGDVKTTISINALLKPGNKTNGED